MSALRRTSAIAALAKRQIAAKFRDGELSPMVRVTCLEVAEIVALVGELREWKAPSDVPVRVVVTAERQWEGLNEDEMVPRGGESPTTLRNQRGVAVVLIEGDNYTDRQSWQSVRPISDASLLEDAESRHSLVATLYGEDPPGLLVEVLEEVHGSIRDGKDDHVSVRGWVAFVDEVCQGIPDGAVDSMGAWMAVGRALPIAKLFPDDRLAVLSATDRRRHLKKNLDDSHRLLFQADDRWRDTLEERATALTLVEPNGDPVEAADRIRASMLKLIGGDENREQSNVPFLYWQQLTSATRERKGLGARIRDFLVDQHPELVAPYDSLSVQEGVDQGTPEAAETLLEDEDARPILARLTTKQIAALERVATPRAPTTTAPLGEVVRAVADMVNERAALTEGDADECSAFLTLEPRRTPAEASDSRAIFAWLFGPCLAEVASRLGDDLLSFRVDDALLDFSVLAGFESSSVSEDDDEPDGNFDTLELVLRWSDGLGSETRIDWAPKRTPGLVALWRLCGAASVAAWAPGDELGFETWLSSSLQRGSMLGAVPAPVEPPAEVVQRWRDERERVLRSLASTGLVASSLREYAGAYSNMLAELKERYIPSGAARGEVDGVLSCDLYVDGDNAAVLATHPIRLRWVAAYFTRVVDLLSSALKGELHTNPVNPDLFFEELVHASPQGQPPVAVIGENLFVAVREQNWHEHLAPLKDTKGERRDWLADLDDGAIDDVANTIGGYLASYPHKTDGLHVLYVVRRQGARGLERLVRILLGRVKKVKGAPLILTLFVDPREVREVEEALQVFDDADHRAFSDKPPVRVNLHAWVNPDDELPDVSGIEPLVDVAVVPNLFGASTRTHDGTRDGRQDTGSFDPLLDEPTRLEPVGGGAALSTAVSRVLLPYGRDELLETWSTVTTRQFRGSPVGESTAGAGGDYVIDHVTVQVSLDKNREFFDELHRCAHWVVTVDAFVGREQVEALKDGPDVIRVKAGVGANGAYRMVVSSKAGRKFVESRVARRLQQQIESDALPEVEALAANIYDRARLLVPGLVLRSLGLGRTAAEMVGLVLARTRVEQRFPAEVGAHGFQTWLSLDEHPEWSGGHQTPRADMARICGWMSDRTLHLQVDVVEAKMRTSIHLARAERQISRSKRLLEAALGPNEEGGYADRPMWHRLVWRAIEQTSSAADGTPAATHAISVGGPRAGLDETLQAAFRQGDVCVEAVRGILLTMVPGETGEDALTPEGHIWLKMTLKEARAELTRLGSEPLFPLHPKRDAGPAPQATLPRTAGISAAEAPAERADGERAGLATSTPAPRGGASDTARKRMQDLLDALYKRDVQVTPAGGEDSLEGPGFFLLRVRLGPNVRPQSVFNLRDDLQYHLGLEAGQLPRMYVDRGAVVVELPKRDDERYYIDAEDLWERVEWPKNRLYAPLGSDVRDAAVGVDFSSSRSPHLLVGGMTGGGKSVALEALLMGLVHYYSADQLELRIIDPKGNEFTQFEEMEHVREPPGMDAEDAIELLGRTCDEMDARYRAMKELSQSSNKRVRDIAAFNDGARPEDRFRWVVVVLDEFADLTSDKEDKKKIEALLQRIAQKARACGIHAIVATQKPSAEVISTTTRSNLGAQLALRVRSATDSRVIMDMPGAESLAGNGDAFLRLSGEEPIRLQCAKYR